MSKRIRLDAYVTPTQYRILKEYSIECEKSNDKDVDFKDIEKFKSMLKRLSKRVKYREKIRY